MRHSRVVPAVVCLTVLFGCSSSDSDTPSSGASAGGAAMGMGGSYAAGGVGMAGTGGSSTSGGTVGSGTGGAPAVATGGIPSTAAGGAPPGTGGAAVATGGTNAANGGAGGTAPAGTGGTSSSGGSTATGGAPSTVPPVKSAGCDAAQWPPSGNQTLDVSGTSRAYIVKIPDGYRSSTPYRLVFAWHGLGGTAQQVASGFRGGYYGLESRAAGSTIFVAGQGLETSQGGAGWPNTNGRDIAFVRAMLDWLDKSYCIDQKRIFSVGMSYGGIMSNTIGCQMGDVFRAIAPMSGMGPLTFGGQKCVGQVAAWMSHGNQDTVVAFSSGQASRDHWVQANHCTTQTAPVAPGTCVAYQGCDAGFPVHWCEFDGGHTVPSFASEGIWNFLSQF